jgi:anti-sigma factor RsiW
MTDENEGRETMNANEPLLHAYHDGELSGLARWRFERRLRRSPELRAELGRLEHLRGLLRTRDGDEPGPDLWGAIALRLPALDAAAHEGRDETVRGRAAGGPGPGLSWWLKPAGAVVATAAVAGIVVYGGDWQEAPTSGGVVRWLDSGGRSVMVLDDEPDTTIIWVLDGATDGAWIGGRRDEA